MEFDSLYQMSEQLHFQISRLISQSPRDALQIFFLWPLIEGFSEVGLSR